MEITFDFRRLLAHDRWANGESLASLERMANPPAKGLELAGHVIGAELAWIDRMTVGKDPANWEEFERGTPPWLRRQWAEVLPPRWEAFLADAKLSDPGRDFTYVNYLGQTWTRRVGDIAAQLMLHSAYHRGQIASLVRAAGGEPAVVDFLRAVQNGVPGVGIPA